MSDQVTVTLQIILSQDEIEALESIEDPTSNEPMTVYTYDLLFDMARLGLVKKVAMFYFLTELGERVLEEMRLQRSE